MKDYSAETGAALAAEIERLNIALIAASEGTKDREYAEACFIRADKLLTADERTLHAEIELLRADAGRLDFLEKHPDKVLAVGPRWYSRTGYRLPMCGRKDLRSAIDAAMKEQQ